MNVHMVTHWMGKRSAKQPWPRLVRYLQKYLGWSASHKLDRQADVNYILTYTVGWQRNIDPWKTWQEWGGPLVCRIGERPEYGLKARLWDEAVDASDLRLVEAAKYVHMLSEYGLTEQVELFPVERGLFAITESLPHSRPTIGVVGYCATGGRKGERLVKELAHYPGARHWRVKAAGRGWPVETKEYHYRDLPRFYQSVDVHLCPTVSRDSPTSPYEALACGIPVVLPQGVDLLDELPSIHGIYHYEMGDFDAMYEALRRCIADLTTHDREALRAVTRHMTVEAFCKGHQDVFEKHFGRPNDYPHNHTRILTEDTQAGQGPELLRSEKSGTGSILEERVWAPGSVLEDIPETAHGPDATELPLERSDSD